MDPEFINFLTSDDGLAVYAAVLTALLLGGIGAPIPEDIPILLGGVAAAKGVVRIPGMFATCFAGVLASDQLVFLIGHFFGQKMLNAGTRSPLFPSITEDKILEVREGLRKKRLLYIFIGRHLFPVRSVTFLTAGALRIPYWEFFFADALAAVISVSVVFGLGYYLGEAITPDVVEHFAKTAHLYLAGLAALCGIFFLGRRILRRKKRVSASVPERPVEERP